MLPMAANVFAGPSDADDTLRKNLPLLRAVKEGRLELVNSLLQTAEVPSVPRARRATSSPEAAPSSRTTCRHRITAGTKLSQPQEQVSDGQKKVSDGHL